MLPSEGLVPHLRIVDDHLKIRAVNAKYRGSVFIWKHSGIRRYIQTDYENGNTNSWLLAHTDVAILILMLLCMWLIVDRIGVSKHELVSMLWKKSLRKQSSLSLVLANKQDTEGALTVAEVHQALGLDALQNRTFQIFKTSAVCQGGRSGRRYGMLKRRGEKRIARLPLYKKSPKHCDE